MTHFTYTAKGSNGAEKSGSVEAMSLQAAREQVVAMGLDPIEIYETPADSAKTAQPTPKKAKPPRDTAYLPMFETLRLYAGWLLAWYALVYIIGAYQFSKALPFRIPYAESLFLSPLVLSFTFAAFLFLLLSSVYKHFGRKKIFGIILTFIGIAVFLLYRMNVQ
jgi:hypothetical protein